MPPPTPQLPATRTPAQQSLGTIVALVVIIGMIVVGAFYAWGKRIAEERAFIGETASSTQTY
jgi:ABC-type transporter Mla subunit MlaD